MTVSAELSFATHIRPLFRDRDVATMKRVRNLDLSDHGQVSARADDILDRLELGDMPCDSPWDAQRIGIFSTWMATGKLP